MALMAERSLLFIKLSLVNSVSQMYFSYFVSPVLITVVLYSITYIHIYMYTFVLVTVFCCYDRVSNKERLREKD